MIIINKSSLCSLVNVVLAAAGYAIISEYHSLHVVTEPFGLFFVHALQDLVVLRTQIVVIILLKLGPSSLRLLLSYTWNKWGYKLIAI